MHKRTLALVVYNTSVLVNGRALDEYTLEALFPERSASMLTTGRTSLLTSTACPLPRAGSLVSPQIDAAIRTRVDELHREGGSQWLETWLGEAVQKAYEQLRILLLMFSDLGMTSEVSQAQKENFTFRLTWLNLIDRGEAYLKWKCAHIACCALGQSEFPARPDWADPSDRAEFILGGSCYAFTRRQIHSRSRSFGWNISQVKKGMPVVSDRAVELGVAKTIVALSTSQAPPPEEGWLMFSGCSRSMLEPWDPYPPSEDSLDWDTGKCEDTRFCIETLVAECKRTARELFPPGWYKPQPIFTPSISGHFYSSRGKTGALGALVRERTDNYLLMSYSYLPPKSIVIPLVEDTDDPVDTCCGLARFCACCGWHPTDGRIFLYPNSNVHRVLKESLEFDRRHAHSELMAVRPVGLKEPFKVRVITGGPEGKYYRTKYIQKATHSHLRRHPCASLIGETITADRLNAVLPQPRAGEYYVSGDYSAATDNINPYLSEAVAEEIGSTAFWDNDWIDLYIESLTGHSIYDGGKKLPPEDLERLRRACRRQKWGQLMGSPTSFPVLCVINLALTRHSQELRDGRILRVREQPLRCVSGVIESEPLGALINGDDIGFVTDDHGYDLWKKVTFAGGLEPSMGKNFRSEDFIVLNSTWFDITGGGTGHADEPARPRALTYRPYINYGLLQCRNENGTPIQDLAQCLAPSGDPRTPDIGTLARDLVRGHPEALQLSLLKRFVAAWKPSLDLFCPKGMSYYLPSHLGGLGLPVIGEFHGPDGRGRYSRCQRVLATFLANDPERAALLQSTSHIGRSESLSLWKKISPLHEELLKDVHFEWTKEPSVDHDGGALTASLLAGAYADLQPEEVAETELAAEENRYQEWRRSYEKLFDQARKSTFPPMSDEDMASDRPWRKRYDDYTVYDFAPKVDLRNSPNHVLEPNWSKPSIRKVSDRELAECQEQEGA